jgi:hypothetical protein
MLRLALSIALALGLAAVAPVPAHAAKKFRNTHNGVPPAQVVTLSRSLLASGGGQMFIDGVQDSLLVLGTKAFVVTDIIVTLPDGTPPDTTTPIEVAISFGLRNFFVKEIGARSYTYSFAGGLMATPGADFGVNNYSSVPVDVKVIGYLVEGPAPAQGVSPIPPAN